MHLRKRGIKNRWFVELSACDKIPVWNNVILRVATYYIRETMATGLHFLVIIRLHNLTQITDRPKLWALSRALCTCKPGAMQLA